MRRFLAIWAIALLSVMFMAVAATGFFYGEDCVVTGTAFFYGKPADAGTPIAAFIAETKVAESIIKDNGSFELKIPEYDSAKPEINGYKSPDDLIQVKLSGKIAKPTFSPDQSNLKVDLRVETTLDVKLSTWGKIKALFK